MAKRFTDTEKWRRPWFRQLSNEYKLLWYYILDTCDMIGVWYVDIELASFLIGIKISKPDALKAFRKQIRVLDKSRWFVKDFVGFQYGKLVPTNNMHKSAIAKLKAANIPISPNGSDKKFQGLPRGSPGAQEKPPGAPQGHPRGQGKG